MHAKRTDLAAALVVALVACSSSSSNKQSTPSLPASSTTVSATPVTFGALQLIPNPNSVLSFELKYTTSAPTVTTLHLDGPGGAVSVQPESTATETHDLPVVGLRARSSYRAWVTANANRDASQKITITTKALPADFPTLLVKKSVPARMAPGVTLFSVSPLGAAPNANPMLGIVVAVDRAGQVVWYYRAQQPIGDQRMLPNGHLLVEVNNMGAREIDVLGRTVREWAGRLERGPLRTDQYGRTVPGPHAIPVDADSIHHEVGMLPNDHILTLSNELRTVSGFTMPMCGEPASEFTGSYKLITDVVVEFDAATGAIVHKYPIADYFHPQTNPADANICGMPGAAFYPNFLYGGKPDVHDWTHANAVILDAPNNRLLVSLRHLDVVLAIRYHDDAGGKAGDLLWRMGPQGGDFAMTPGGLWHYHQHAVELQSDGSLLLFDNGNDRPKTNHLFSRAVRYSFTDSGPKSGWTVKQVWEYRPTVDGTPAYGFFVGDANHLANGNVLIDTGGIIPATNGANAQIDEVIPAANGAGGELVFELRVTAPVSFVYRATRVPSLYGETGS